MSNETNMRICYDDAVFQRQVYGGISRYFIELAKAIKLRNPAIHVDVPTFSKNSYLNDFNRNLWLASIFGKKRSVAHALNRLREATRRTKPMFILHHTLYPRPDRRTTRANRSARRIVTIHDMTPELYPKQFAKGNPHAFKDYWYANACGVVFVSEQTRDDAERIYGPCGVPNAVIPLAAGIKESPGGNFRRTSTAPFLLYVGSRTDYKRFDVLVDALALTPSDIRPDLTVVGPPFSAAERLLLQEKRIDATISWREANDKELTEIYAHAMALVITSDYEGFGLPVLEAMASGCVVVHSDAPALSEVSAGHALIFPRGDSEALQRQIIRLVRASQSDELAGLVESARERARQFTWDRVAYSTLQFYREVLLT